MSTHSSKSTQNEINTLEEGLEPLAPLEFYKDMNVREKKLFDTYIRSKANRDWYDHELAMLVQLARITARIDDLQIQSRDEPDIIPNAKLVPVINPIFPLISRLIEDQRKIITCCQINSAAVGNRNEVQNRAKNITNKRRSLSKKTPTKNGNKVSLLATSGS